MPHHDDERDDLEVAREAIDRRDWKHAAVHIAGRIGDNPGDADAIEMADFIAAAVGEGAVEKLAPISDEGETYFGLVALRARLLAREKKYGEALGLLVQIAAVKPELPWSEWAEEWAEDMPAFAAFDPMELAGRIGGVMDSLLEGPGWKTGAAIVKPAFDANPADVLCLPLAALHRRAGDAKGAEAIARRTMAKEPRSYRAHVALYNALRAQGRHDEAVTVMHAAIELDPADESVLLDLGDLLLDLGRAEESTAAYADALSRAPGNEWAAASLPYSRWLANGACDDWRALEALAARGDERAAELFSRDAFFWSAPYGAPEAIVNVVRQILDQQKEAPPATGEPSSIKVTVSALEAPSARLACERELLRRGWTVAMTVAVEKIPVPDPRLDHRSPARALWRFSGTDAAPAVDPPSREISAAVARLAATDYSLAGWRVDAREHAASLPPGAIDGLLATMVHPPDAPRDVSFFDWLPRVQIAAAFLIAALDPPAGGAGEQALLAVLDGPDDWAAVAATIALAEAAHERRAQSAALLNRFFDRLEQRPTDGHWCLYLPLVAGSLRLPAIDAKTRDTLRDMLRKLTADA